MTKVKRGPLNKAEAFYVDGKRNELTAEQIAEDLNRSKVTIENYIKKNPVNENSLTIGDQFARQSGATIMTENASSMADMQRKKTRKPSSECVTKAKR